MPPPPNVQEFLLRQLSFFIHKYEKYTSLSSEEIFFREIEFYLNFHPLINLFIVGAT